MVVDVEATILQARGSSTSLSINSEPRKDPVQFKCEVWKRRLAEVRDQALQQRPHRQILIGRMDETYLQLQQRFNHGGRKEKI